MMATLFAQHLHPYVSAMVNNGSITYDHDMDGTLTQLAGCHARARGRKVDTLIAIRYAENVLTVRLPSPPPPLRRSHSSLPLPSTALPQLLVLLVLVVLVFLRLLIFFVLLFFTSF